MQQQLFELATTKYFGIYRGQVINNNDPDQAGKCQINIGPMFLGITSANLPWAFPAMPMSFGSGVGYGTMNIPQEKSWVYCFFLEGDVYQPIYFLEAPTLTQGIPANILTDYPSARGFASPSGITVTIDDSLPQVTVTHPTGTSVNIDRTGTVNIVAPVADTSGNFSVGAGASGVFISADGQVITVANGIIVSMV